MRVDPKAHCLALGDSFCFVLIGFGIMFIGVN